MSLRRSPTRTPALLAAIRQNSKKSTGPRTARGKAWSRLNRLRHGTRSPEYIRFFKALFDAPDGRMTAHAQTLLASMPVVHPVYWTLPICAYRWKLKSGKSPDANEQRQRENEFIIATFEVGMSLKTKSDGILKSTTSDYVNENKQVILE